MRLCSNIIYFSVPIQGRNFSVLNKAKLDTRDILSWPSVDLMIAWLARSQKVGERMDELKSSRSKLSI